MLSVIALIIARLFERERARARPERSIDELIEFIRAHGGAAPEHLLSEAEAGILSASKAIKYRAGGWADDGYFVLRDHHG